MVMGIYPWLRKFPQRKHNRLSQNPRLLYTLVELLDEFYIKEREEGYANSLF